MSGGPEAGGPGKEGDPNPGDIEDPAEADGGGADMGPADPSCRLEDSVRRLGGLARLPSSDIDRLLSGAVLRDSTRAAARIGSRGVMASAHAAVGITQRVGEMSGRSSPPPDSERGEP